MCKDPEADGAQLNRVNVWPGWKAQEVSRGRLLLGDGWLLLLPW